jgi:hypothetical protein
MSKTRIGWRPLTLAACAMTLALAAGSVSAKAMVISSMPDVSFASLPATITFGTSSLVFTSIPGTFPGNPPDEVSTTGSAMVTTAYGGVTDFSAGATIDKGPMELYTFAAYTTPAVIPTSAVDDFIGLAFTLGDGIHYGYAEVDGTDLVSYGYESVPGTTILTGAIPEPATIGVLLSGIALLTGARRRKTTFTPQATVEA